jgi:hypothetical protein
LIIPLIRPIPTKARRPRANAALSSDLGREPKPLSVVRRIGMTFMMAPYTKAERQDEDPVGEAAAARAVGRRIAQIMSPGC